MVKIFIILCLFIPSAVLPYSPEEIKEKLDQHIRSLETMKGSISLIYQTGEIYSGTFVYMNPGKIYIKLIDPPGKVIVTDSKKLWIYDSSTDVCGVQELETEEEEETEESAQQKKESIVKLSGGIIKLMESYEIESAVQEPSGYSITMINERLKYSEIKLILNSDFNPKGMIFKNVDEEGFTIELKNISTGERVTPGIFNFDVPSSAQVIKNPLDIR